MTEKKYPIQEVRENKFVVDGSQLHMLTAINYDMDKHQAAEHVLETHEKLDDSKVNIG